MSEITFACGCKQCNGKKCAAIAPMDKLREALNEWVKQNSYSTWKEWVAVHGGRPFGEVARIMLAEEEAAKQTVNISDTMTMHACKCGITLVFNGNKEYLDGWRLGHACAYADAKTLGLSTDGPQTIAGKPHEAGQDSSEVRGGAITYSIICPTPPTAAQKRLGLDARGLEHVRRAAWDSDVDD